MTFCWTSDLGLPQIIPPPPARIRSSHGELKTFWDFRFAYLKSPTPPIIAELDLHMENFKTAESTLFTEELQSHYSGSGDTV